MGEQFLFDQFWLPVVLWIAVYISDYALTIYGARLYKDASQYFSIEGSYELTPYYQHDINALRLVSMRFLLALFGSAFLLLVVRGLAMGLPAIFAFVCGMFLLMEVPVHIRHIRNITLYKQLSTGVAATGQLSYTRWFVYWLSATEIFVFAIVFLLLSILLTSWFFLGGAVMCVRIAISHLMLSNKARKQPATLTP
jgi:hypothetical protein